MRILVLGGCGDMGSYAVRDLLAHSDAEVTVADRRLDTASRLVRELGSRATVVAVDATDDRALVDAMHGYDAAVGCIGPFYAFAAPMTRAAIRAGTPYVDICDDWGPVDELHDMHGWAQAAGVPVINGLGWTPGISNLLAARAASELDDVDEVRIAWAGGAADSSGLAVVMHVAYAVSGEVPTFANGRRMMVAARSAREAVEFPPPLGMVHVSHCGHPEPLTLPERLKARTVSLKGGLTPDWNNKVVDLLARLGLFATPARIARVSRLVHRIERVFAVGGVPVSGVRVDVHGTAHARRRTVSYAVVDRMGRLTGIPAAIGAVMLANRTITTPGVHAPEDVVAPEPFFDELARRGVAVVTM